MKNINKAEKICITIPPDMLLNIKEKVKSGAYSSTSEVIREAMRLWQKQQEEHDARIALIRKRLENSANSGTAIPIDQAFEKIKKLHQNHLNNFSDESL
ncbi:MAG: type II toxin-antitoxin system ParD family antitoxin [Methylococcaceae bacterium]|nr:type II toxin-antitoxin system ParD family antitoxin [Methylococcaceae bacterium]